MFIDLENALHRFYVTEIRDIYSIYMYIFYLSHFELLLTDNLLSLNVVLLLHLTIFQVLYTFRTFFFI
jgi:hypothetical protein